VSHDVAKKKQAKQIIQIVSFWDGQAKFFEQGLQVFLRRLLAMEAKLIMKGLASSADSDGETKVAFRFAYPLSRASSHKALCLLSQFPCGTIHPPQDANGDCKAYGQ
jgi:hypothetical protein